MALCSGRMFVSLDYFGASGFPGPKCFSSTNGSVALGFSTRTPSLGRIRRDEQLVLSHLAIANDRWRFHRVCSDGAMALRQDQTIRRAVAYGYSSAWAAPSVLWPNNTACHKLPISRTHPHGFGNTRFCLANSGFTFASQSSRLE